MTFELKVRQSYNFIVHKMAASPERPHIAFDGDEEPLFADDLDDFGDDDIETLPPQMPSLAELSAEQARATASRGVGGSILVYTVILLLTLFYWLFNSFISQSLVKQLFLDLRQETELIRREIPPMTEDHH